MTDVNMVTTSDAPQHRLGYDGRGRDIAKIALWNGFLTFITLGIFRFWAKTRMRRYVWSRFSLDGDRVEYTGTGGELFKGFLVAFGLFLLFVIPLQIAIAMVGPLSWVAGALNVVYVVVTLLLVSMAPYFAQRYRLTRTRWRGIRGGLHGKPLSYAGMVLAYALLTLITLGIAYPIGSLAKQRYLWNHSRIGTADISCEAKVGRAWMPWLAQYACWVALVVFAVLLGKATGASAGIAEAMDGSLSDFQLKRGSPLAIGIWVFGLTVALVAGSFCAIAYSLREFRQILNGMKIGNAHLQSTLKARSMIWRIIVVALIQVVSLGLLLGVFAALAWISATGGHVSIFAQLVPLLMIVLLPFITVFVIAIFWTNPLYRTIATTTVLVGAVDMASIGQNTDSAPTRGEGLMELFAVDG